VVPVTIIRYGCDNSAVHVEPAKPFSAANAQACLAFSTSAQSQRSTRCSLRRREAPEPPAAYLLVAILPSLLSAYSLSTPTLLKSSVSEKEAKDTDIKEYFGTFGDIENINLKMDPMTGRSRGFAFIVFKELAGIEAALAQTAHVVKGKKVIIIAQQIAQGMGYLHHKGIIHKVIRELKVHQQQSEDLHFTRASDIYAFGTVWYELLTGEWPWKEQPPEAIIWQSLPS